MKNKKSQKGICPVCRQTVDVLPEGIATNVCLDKLSKHPESPLHTCLDPQDPNNYVIKSHVDGSWGCKGGNCAPVEILE